MQIEQKLEAMGLVLPQPIAIEVPFSWVRVRGGYAFISGHAPLAADGSIAQPVGKLGDALMVEQGYRAAMHGIAMHRPWIEVYDRPDVFALEDWR